MCSGAVEVFSHFQSDEPCAHDHGAPDPVRGHVGFDTVGVVHVAEREDAFRADPLQRRPHGDAPGESSSLS